MRIRNRFAMAFLLCLFTLFGWQGAEAAGVAADSISTTIVSHPKAKSSGAKHWRHVGGNRFRGNDKRAWRQHGLNKAEIAEMALLVKKRKYEWAVFASGQQFSSVSFGKNRIWKNTVAAWKPGKSYAARLYHLSSGKVIARVAWCRNWAVPVIVPVKRDMAGLKAIIKSVPLPEVTPVTVLTPKEGPCSGYAKLDYEFNAGVFEYHNNVVHGDGGFMDASLLFDAGKGFRVGPGIFAAGTGGELNNDEFWWDRPWTAGPQLTVDYASGNQGVVSKTRFLIGAGYKEGSSDHSYYFGQTGGLFNQYLEYYKRPSANFKWGLVGDICIQSGQHVTESSNQYAEIKDLGSLYFGAYAQRWVSPDVAIRGKLGFRYENIIKEWSFKPEVTARYKEFLYLGSGLNIPLNGNAVSFETLAGVELRGTIQKAYQNANGKVKYVGTVSTYGENHSENGSSPVGFGVKLSDDNRHQDHSESGNMPVGFGVRID